jgi:hypothetical protein
VCIVSWGWSGGVGGRVESRVRLAKKVEGGSHSIEFATNTSTYQIRTLLTNNHIPQVRDRFASSSMRKRFMNRSDSSHIHVDAVC